MTSLEKVPAELRQRPNWVLWKMAARAEGGAPTKLPFQANGSMAKANDKSTWGTFEAQEEALRRGGYAGVGFEFAEGEGICGIDLDGCRDVVTGKVADWAAEILRRVNSYSEVSPSGSGVKIWLRGKLPLASGKKLDLDFKRVAEKAPAIEMYDKGRYFAVTGQRLAGLSPAVEERQAELDELCKRFWPDEAVNSPGKASPAWHAEEAVIERARRYLAKMPPAVSGSSGHNATFHAACVLLLGFGLSLQEALVLLREWNQTCQPPWSDKELEHKAIDASKVGGERNYLRLAKPENWEKIKVPNYAAKAPKPKPEPRATTLEGAAQLYLQAISKGSASTIELGIPDLDYALGGGVEFGEMVIVAARPSHGKSAVALQMIHHATSNGLTALIISEEMSALAIGKRVVQFASALPQEHWAGALAELEGDMKEHFCERKECYIVEGCRSAQVAADQIRKHVKDYGVKLVVVDYAQLLAAEGKGRYEQITNTSIALRQAANETGAILLVLCQLNRSIEGRQKFIPMLSDLKETGQLEQDADVVIFGVWPWKVDNSMPPNGYQFFVAKNRNRAINQAAVDCRFDPNRQTFRDARTNEGLPLGWTTQPTAGDF